MTATKLQIAIDVVTRLGAARAKDGTHLHPPVYANKTGYHGVDYVNGKFRSRIRFSDALSGRDVRLTLGRFENVEDAGYAYAAAHVALWGGLSYFAGDVTCEDIAAARAAGLVSNGRADTAGLCG